MNDGLRGQSVAESAVQRVAALIPSFNHYEYVGDLLERLLPLVEAVFIVDDASASPASEALVRLAAGRARVTLVRREQNGGKGAAVKTGLRALSEAGFTHALQVDADAQHDLDSVAAMLGASRTDPTALVLAEPVFDASAPKGRLWARRICNFWVDLETGGRVIGDPMCGLRIYPVEAALVADAKGDRMDFDPEIAVRMQWRGAPVINIPTRVIYREGALSNFQSFRDNVRISWMHSRLMFRLIMSRVFSGMVKRR